MPIEQQLSDEVLVDRRDYEGRSIIAIDFGPAADPAIDIVGDTAIIVDRDGDQHELSLPAGEVEAFNQNGILTIEVTR